MSDQVDEKQINALAEAVEQGLERSIDVRESAAPKVPPPETSATGEATLRSQASKKDLSSGQKACLMVCGCIMVAAIFFFIGFYVFIYFLSKALTN